MIKRTRTALLAVFLPLGFSLGTVGAWGVCAFGQETITEQKPASERMVAQVKEPKATQIFEFDEIKNVIKVLTDNPQGAANDENAKAAVQKLHELSIQLSDPKYSEERKVAETLLVDALQKLGPTQNGTQIVKVLARIGSQKSADVLFSSLNYAEQPFFDEVIAALAAIPGESTRKVLVELLEQTTDYKKKIACISALGFRAEPESVDAILSEACDFDNEIEKAAISDFNIDPKIMDQNIERSRTDIKHKLEISYAVQEALANIGNSRAAFELQNLRRFARSEAKHTYNAPMIICANRLLVFGSRVEALSIFQEYNTSRVGKVIRRAALHGMLTITTAPNDINFFLFLFPDTLDDKQVWNSSVYFLWRMKYQVGDKISQEVFSELAPKCKLAILQAFAEKKDHTALPLVTSSINDIN
ncbi:MAG: hypothetical protein ACRC2T_13910, partial [Thermoguttaceae bacterium]